MTETPGNNTPLKKMHPSETASRRKAYRNPAEWNVSRQIVRNSVTPQGV